MTAWIPAALVLGFASSGHCLGMCGPIALAVPSPGTGWRSRLNSTLLLNSGRLATYTLLGAAFGTFGRGLQLVGLQQTVSILAGALILLSVLVPGLLERWSPTGHLSLMVARFRGVLGRNLKRTAPEALFATGLLNGLLPCGMVYAAAIGATAMGAASQGALFMVLFGLGTWPALIALRMSGHMIGGGGRTLLRRMSPVVVSVLGILMILRGLELGIPMVSPPPDTIPAQATVCP